MLTYSPDDLKRLLAVAPDTFIPCLALAAFAGMRSAEIERIGWDNIRIVTQNEADRVINLEAGIAKTNSRRTISIHETLAQWLNPHIRPHQPVWPGSHSHFYRLQQQIAKDACIQWKQNALRHTCISALVAIDKNVPQVAYESGNSTTIIKQHYLQLMPPSTAEAWFSITPVVVHRYKEEQKKRIRPGNPSRQNRGTVPKWVPCKTHCLFASIRLPRGGRKSSKPASGAN